MAKVTRMYMKRRGVRYLIERTADGTFKKFIPTDKIGAKKASAKKASAKTSSRSTARKPAAASRRARV